MQLRALLLRLKQNVNKKTFGHVLVLAGSPNMLGAACLTSLATIRSGSGLVTLGIPKSLNSTVQKKISNVIMTFPLDETKERTLALPALKKIQKKLKTYDVIAMGPGLSRHPNTEKLILRIIENINKPLVIDADALTALSHSPSSLLMTSAPKILTPHPGEMARLANVSLETVEKSRRKIALEFARSYKCIVVLKGHHTIVASPAEIYVNKTGNPGMATAGSGDVLTGMVAAFLGQGLTPFEAAKYAAYFHGKAGDLAAEEKTRLSMIATDIIDHIPMAVSLRSIQEKPKNF